MNTTATEIYESDLEERLNEILDDDGDVEICGLTYSQSRVLKQIDPIAYRELLNNFIDGLITDGELYEHNGDYYDEDPTEDEDEELN